LLAALVICTVQAVTFAVSSSATAVLLSFHPETNAESESENVFADEEPDDLPLDRSSRRAARLPRVDASTGIELSRAGKWIASTHWQRGTFLTGARCGSTSRACDALADLLDVFGHRVAAMGCANCFGVSAVSFRQACMNLSGRCARVAALLVFEEEP
jgi:hypothetical protein